MAHYGKDLTSLTSVRLTPPIRAAAQAIADEMCISLSDFVRQSIIRNIVVSRQIEPQIRRRMIQGAMGDPSLG
jgi:hypothetical protein